MDKLAYKLKSLFDSIKAFFHSTEFLKVFDKVMKVLRNIVPKILIYFTLIAFCYVFMYPILNVLVDSFKTETDIVNPDVKWIPTTLTLKNYKNAMNALWISKIVSEAWVSTLYNSVIFSLITALLETFVSCLAGYAFARFSFKGKGLWFAGLILGFILPTQLLTLPRSMMLRNMINGTASASKILGLTATNYKIDASLSFLSTSPIILLTFLGQGVNSSILIFIFFSFFKMIPQSLDEAAQIDGANFLQIFYHIIVKMSVSTILVVFLFAFIWNWNETYALDQLVALNDNNVGFKSLPQALQQFNRIVSQGSKMSGIESDKNNGALKSAGIIFSIIPLLVLYAFTQRKFVEGIENTGVTGV